MSLAVLLTGVPSAAVAEADPALPSEVPASSTESVRPGQTPRIRLERSGRFEWPARLRFRDVAETGRSQTLQRWIPPGPWRNAGLVPPSGSGVDAALPVPDESGFLFTFLKAPSSGRELGYLRFAHMVGPCCLVTISIFINHLIRVKSHC